MKSHEGSGKMRVREVAIVLRGSLSRNREIACIVEEVALRHHPFRGRGRFATERRLPLQLLLEVFRRRPELRNGGSPSAA